MYGMTNGDFPVTLPGESPGPPAPDYYKRAVYRAAPTHFNVEVLPPQKIGGAFSYGLRIYPIHRENASARSRMSVASTSSDYTVWRRWEDCLWFQDMLELQYEIRSREKRQRLAAGKGVKKNGIYIHDRAASFESLPPGPDPKSVAKNVHDYLPKLSKKGTLFRPSQSTIDQRHREFSALINAFFQDDVPALIRELRDDRVIRDFFGYWRRDNDLLTKKTSASRASIGGSNAFSLYFSSSNISLSLPDATLPDMASTRSSSGSSSATSARPPGKRNSAGSASSMSLSDSDGGSRHRLRGSSKPLSAPPRVHEFDQQQTSSTALDDEIQTVPRKDSMGATSIAKSARSSHHTSPRSSKSRSHSSKPTSNYNMAEDFPLFLSSSTRDPNKPSQPPRSPSQQQPLSPGGLESLPEDSELGSTPTQDTSAMGAPNSPSPRSSRLRASSRNEFAIQELTPTASGQPEPGHHRRRSSATTGEPGSPRANSSRPSSVALSTLSMHDAQGSDFTSPRSDSRPLSIGSFAESFNEIDVPYMELPNVHPSARQEMEFSLDQSFPLSPINSRFNRASVDSDILSPGFSLSPGRSISPQPGHRHSPSAGANIRRSSGGSIKRRPRSHSQPMPMGMGSSFAVPEEEPWGESYLGGEGGDDLIDAYFQPSSSGPDSTDSHQSGQDPSPVDLRPRGAKIRDSILSQDEEFGMDGLVLDDFEFDDGAGVRLSTFSTGDIDQFPSPPDRSSASFRFSTSSLTPVPVTAPLSPRLQAYRPTNGGSRPGTASSDMQVPSSPTFSAEDSGGTLIVKAALDDAIISFRTSRSTTFSEVHQRLYEKFAQQEGLPLPQSFKVAFLPPFASVPSALGDADNNVVEKRKNRGSTMSTVSSVAGADSSRLVPIGNQEEWENAVRVCGQKVVLRVL